MRTAAAAYGIPKSTLYDYASGKVEFGSKRGPDTILTAAEEQKLVDYVIHMAEIGYRCTEEHICDTVKEILDKNGRPNPFNNNRPGRKWWSLFVQRHPNIMLQFPGHLQLTTVSPPQAEVLGVIENMLKPETLQLYNTRYEESYDIQDDELYVIWSKLKNLSIANEPKCVSNPSSEENQLALLPEKHQKVSSVLGEVLTYPESAKQKPSKQGKGASSYPKHLTSDHVIAYLEEKKMRKEREEDEKQKHKEE